MRGSASKTNLWFGIVQTLFNAYESIVKREGGVAEKVKSLAAPTPGTHTITLKFGKIYTSPLPIEL